MAYRKKRSDGIPSTPNKQRVSLRQAADYTSRYRRSAPASEHAGFFWAEGLRAVLDQPDCSGVRVYHGLAKNGSYRLVIVGVDNAGDDITRKGAPAMSTRAAAKSSDGEAVILDSHWPCPPFCPRNSPLG